MQAAHSYLLKLLFSSVVSELVFGLLYATPPEFSPHIQHYLRAAIRIYILREWITPSLSGFASKSTQLMSRMLTVLL